MNRIQVLLVGDSDIARWPQNLWPCIETSAVSHSGQQGAILRQIVPYVEAVIKSVEGSPATKIFVVFCCGENDVAQGIDPGVSKELFATVLHKITDVRPDIHVLVLGPKIEPWMDGDKQARASYCDLSSRFHWECKHHRVMPQITYFDCLTMFCKKKGGAKLRGETAVADPIYFDADKLHLSDKGYAVWKQVIEEKIREIMVQSMSGKK